MVSIGWQDAEALCARLSTADVRYCLPTEAEWEKAARGGLVGRRYPWGDESPIPQRCDFDRLGELSIRPMRDLPPNGYGLYGMTGSVWEWTSDWYDSPTTTPKARQTTRPARPPVSSGYCDTGPTTLARPTALSTQGKTLVRA